MAVLVEFFTVIIPLTVLEQKYPGGEKNYIKECPNNTYKSDGELCRVAFMDSMLLDSFITRLISLEFDFDEVRFSSQDFVIAQRLYGFTWGVDWALFNDGVITFREG